MLCGAIDPPEHPVRREGRCQDRIDNSDDDDDDDDDPSSRMRSTVTRTNAQAPKNTRRGSPRKDDSGSEFEFDM